MKRGSTGESTLNLTLVTKMVTTDKLRVLVDMDQVLFKWYDGVLRALKKTAPWLEQIPVEEIKSFHIVDSYPASVKQDLWKAMALPGLYANLEPMEGGLEALKDMAATCSDFIDPFIVSSPWLYCHEQAGWGEKAFCIEKHLGKEWVNRLILTRDKTLIHGDILIDDKPEITGVVADPTWAHLVYSQPWNQAVRDAGAQGFTWQDWPALKACLRAEFEAVKAKREEVPSRIVLLS